MEYVSLNRLVSRVKVNLLTLKLLNVGENIMKCLCSAACCRYGKRCSYGAFCLLAYLHVIFYQQLAFRARNFNQSYGVVARVVDLSSVSSRFKPITLQLLFTALCLMLGI